MLSLNQFNVMDTKLLAAYWSLGQLKSEALPRIAQEALEAGLDVPSLRILAGEKNPTMSDAAPLFEHALFELGVPIPPQREAAIQIARCHAEAIVSGILSPIEGARRIIGEAYRYCDELTELLGFVGLEDQHEEFSDEFHRQYYGEEYCKNVLTESEQAIIQEARSLIGRPTDSKPGGGTKTV